MKRKLVTTAREIIGMADLETNTLPCESLLPETVRAWVPDTSPGAPSVGEQLAQQLKPFDDEWAQRVEAAQAEGKVLKFIGRLDVATGEAGLAIEAVHPTHQLALCSGMQNTIIVFSNRCGARPFSRPVRYRRWFK
jgi:homoserine dehydrogenase